MLASEFQNKIAVVTGGSSGIGKAVVLALADAGCETFFCGRSGDKEGVEAASGGRAHYVQCDITAADGVAKLMRAAGERIDYLVNNVAYDGRLTFDAATADDFDKFVAVNLKAAFCTTHAVLPALRKGAGRAVVNLGTTNWMLGLAPFTLYCSAKSGLVGFTRALARELGPEKIRVNMVSPGWVMTPKQLSEYVTEQDKRDLLRDQALPFLLEEKHIVDPILFLLSSGASAVTGQNLVVDGGKLMQ